MRFMNLWSARGPVIALGLIAGVASILDAQDEYVQAKELDEALFGEDYNE